MADMSYGAMGSQNVGSSRAKLDMRPKAKRSKGKKSSNMDMGIDCPMVSMKPKKKGK